MDSKKGSWYDINGQNGLQGKASDSSRHGQQEGQLDMTSMGRVACRERQASQAERTPVGCQ
jgi:hypothetical protein